MRILVTGASGFVGRAVLERLSLKRKFELTASVRHPVLNPVADAQYFEVGDIAAETSWREILFDVDAVIHAAARAHVISDTALDPLETFRRVNVAGTMRLAQEAADAGVRRFVFVSSIKVNGERTFPGNVFTAEDQPKPADAYGISKYEAESALRDLSQVSDMEVVVIRPPLVYGPGVRANFLALMRCVHKGWPMPLGNVDNRRSLVALENLVDLIATCTVHPAAANQTFTVSDDEDVSTNELINRIGVALNKPARLIPVPIGVIRACAAMAGKRSQADRLLDSLQVDISKTRSILGWSPVVSMEQALADTARHYLGSLHR